MSREDASSETVIAATPAAAAAAAASLLPAAGGAPSPSTSSSSSPSLIIPPSAISSSSPSSSSSSSSPSLSSTGRPRASTADTTFFPNPAFGASVGRDGCDAATSHSASRCDVRILRNRPFPPFLPPPLRAAATSSELISASPIAIGIGLPGTATAKTRPAGNDAFLGTTAPGSIRSAPWRMNLDTGAPTSAIGGPSNVGTRHSAKTVRWKSPLPLTS
eukprot:31534-Pelagococcus_subviridis.AAC.15